MKKPRSGLLEEFANFGAKTSWWCIHDSEFNGMLPKEIDVYELLVRAASGSAQRRSDFAAIAFSV